jgi:hypothetical protein
MKRAKLAAGLAALMLTLAAGADARPRAHAQPRLRTFAQAVIDCRASR